MIASSWRVVVGVEADGVHAHAELRELLGRRSPATRSRPSETSTIAPSSSPRSDDHALERVLDARVVLARELRAVERRA